MNHVARMRYEAGLFGIDRIICALPYLLQRENDSACSSSDALAQMVIPVDGQAAFPVFGLITRIYLISVSRYPVGMTSSNPDGPDDALRQIRQQEAQRFDIRIASDGNWFHEGGLIGRPALVKLFATVLRREADGSYWLVTPAELGTITVDDVPFIVVAMQREGEGKQQRIRFHTNVDDTFLLGPDNPLQMRAQHTELDVDEDGLRPYVLVRDNLQARLTRPVFYELVALSVAGTDGRFGVWSEGMFFPLEASTAEDDSA